MPEGGRKLKLDGHVIETSHEDRVMYPDCGITKGEVIDYYRKVAEHALPYIKQRFLTLQRAPKGIEEDGFYQQARSDHFPDFIQGQRAERRGGGRIEHIAISNAPGLVYLANQGTLTIHAWLSRMDRPDLPDRMVMDLDPPDRAFAPVRHAARIMADFLHDLGMTPYVMTTGSSGLHVVVPLDRSAGFDRVRAFAQKAARRVAQEYPELLTTEQRKDRREGRLYLDVMRNAYGQTAVAPYSLRALPGAPVATPLDWHELDRSTLHARSYHLKNLFRRLGRKEDPWHDFQRHAISLSKVANKL